MQVFCLHHQGGVGRVAFELATGQGSRLDAKQWLQSEENLKRPINGLLLGF